MEALPSHPPLKNPGLACLLSLVIVGAGQLYNDQPKKAAIFFIAVFAGMVFGDFGFFVWLPVAVYAAYDAYKDANQFNGALRTNILAAGVKANTIAQQEAKTGRSPLMGGR